MLSSIITPATPRKIVKLFCSSGASVNSPDNTGKTPLMRAIEIDRRDIVEILLAFGASLQSRDNKGLTPLHYACGDYTADPDLVRFLIEKGSDVEATDNQGRTPLLLLCQNGNSNNNAEIMKILINTGSPIDAVDHDGNTALHFAARRDWYSGTNILLKAGASTSIKNNNEMTPLAAALDSGARRTADQLRLYDMDLLFSDKR